VNGESADCDAGGNGDFAIVEPHLNLFKQTD
jgi:hypothetical protein